MVKSVMLLIALCLLSICSVNTLMGQTANAAPKTVTDYYLALPKQYLPILESLPDRGKLIKIEDVKNGYLRLESAQWEGWGEVAIFKKDQGGYLVVVTQYECAPGCKGEVNFLDYRGGKWSNADVVPRFTYGDLVDIYSEKRHHEPQDDETIVYHLPRQGRAIKIKFGELLVYTLNWDGQQFTGEPAR